MSVNGHRGDLPIAGHVVHTYLPRSETFVYTALRFQTEFRPVVFARHREHLDEFPLDSVYELKPERGPGARVVRRLARVTRTGLADAYAHQLAAAVRGTGCALLHAHFGPTASRSLPSARRLGLPLVTTFYGRDVTDSFGCSYDELFRDGSRFICEGPAMAEGLRAAGCRADRIRLVRIGIDLGRFEFRVPTRTTPFVILQAARFVEKKGFDLSIRAFAAARSSLPRAELWLAGDGELRPELESLVRELGVADDVRFLGMVPHAEYERLARGAHVVIQPSRTASDGDSEGGAPTVLLEMQASGVPIVATRHADIPFVVADPQRLSDEEDVDGLAAALEELARIPEREYRERAEHARAFVEARHDARVVADQIANVYREALGSA